MLLFLNFFRLNAQGDTLILKSTEILVGELKEMNRNVVVLETDYSDSDFKITWKKVSQISTHTQFLVMLKKGDRFNGRLKSNGDHVYIISVDMQIKITV